MRNATAIMLPVVGRARCATGLPARESGSLVARWGSPTPFESHLGLTARIEEWNAGLLHPCPHRSCLPRQSQSCATSVWLSDGIVPSRFIA